MKYPVIVNILVPVIDKENRQTQNIARSVLDLHYSNIVQITANADNTTFVLLRDSQSTVCIAECFEDVYELYKHQVDVDTRFKDNVDMFKNSNYESFIDRVIRNRENGK